MDGSRPRVLVAGAEWCGDVLRGTARALASLGVDVALLPTNVRDHPTLFLDRLSRRFGRLPIAGRRLSRLAAGASVDRHAQWLRGALEELLASWKPHAFLALVDGAYPIHSDLLAAHPAIHKAAWMLDDPFMFVGPWSEGLEEFDALYTVEESARAGLRMTTTRPVRTLPLGADPSVYQPIPGTEKRYRLAFVGKSYDLSPAGAARAALLNRVRHLDLVIWGDAGWSNSLRGGTLDLSNCYRGGPIRSSETNRVYNQSHIALNINHPQIRHGTSLRTFSICSAGAFQLVDWRPGLDDLFEPNLEIVSYQCQDELIELANRYLADESTRERIATAGRLRTTAHHTYQHRLKEILHDAGLTAAQRADGPGRIMWHGPKG
jgi:hypothetical protein